MKQWACAVRTYEYTLAGHWYLVWMFKNWVENYWKNILYHDNHFWEVPKRITGSFWEIINSSSCDLHYVYIALNCMVHVVLWPHSVLHVVWSFAFCFQESRSQKTSRWHLWFCALPTHSLAQHKTCLNSLGSLQLFLYSLLSPQPNKYWNFLICPAGSRSMC